tara:strand:+ start:27583 stop:28212 length:630 start_codon:yes stop_codon:yes gene_type:complete
MANEPLLILGTHNAKKGHELVELLESLPLHICTLADCDKALHVVEDGGSFDENAAKKACQQAVHLKAWVLGEDSGLCVDALDGRPGIYSARFAGDKASDPENNQLLLERMADVSTDGRRAHYVCHAVLSDPEGNIRAEATGKCFGVIRREESGTHGFGYDPLFEIREYHRTFGELGPQLKSAISHRARSISQLIPQIRDLLFQGCWVTE